MNADALATFANALRSRGIVPPAELRADGRMHRCDAEGKNGKGDAAYLLHLDGVPAGGFQNHRDGLGWFNWRAPLRRRLTASEQAQHRVRLDAIRREREAEEARRRKAAAERAAAIWREAKPAAADHPYLVRKGVKPHGVRQHEGRLVIPMRADGELVSLQFIGTDGEKRFLPDGRTKGAYFAIGKPPDVICIAEGFATAATIHETTGHAVAVAFNCGNLEPVARALRAKFPAARLVLCADDDRGTERSPGLAAATLAAKAIGGGVAIPDFGPDRPADAKDFNDLARLRGAEAVRKCLAQASAPAVESAPPIDGALHEVERLDALADGPSEFITRCMFDVRPQPIRWLWPGRIARGKVTLIAGHPGLGKSQLAASLTAIVTQGGRWPVDRRACERGEVLLLNAEDDAADTIRPRLDAAGADVTRVQILEAVHDVASDGRPVIRMFNLKADLDRLAAELARRPTVALVVIDPVSAYLGDTDSHVNADVRALLAPLGEIAARYGVAVVMVSHLNKGGGTGEALLRVTGSLAFVAAARAAFLVVKDKDDPARRLFIPLKNNIGPDAAGLAFRLRGVTLPDGVETCRLEWDREPVTVTADEAMRPQEPEEHRSATDEAVEFLRSLLADGPMKAVDVQKEARQAGILDKPLRSARERLRIKPQKRGMAGGWWWALPAEDAQSAEDAQPQSVGIFDGEGHLRGSEQAVLDDDVEII